MENVVTNINEYVYSYKLLFIINVYIQVNFMKQNGIISLVIGWTPIQSQDLYQGRKRISHLMSHLANEDICGLERLLDVDKNHWAHQGRSGDPNLH